MLFQWQGATCGIYSSSFSLLQHLEEVFIILLMNAVDVDVLKFSFVFWKVQLKGTDHEAALDLLHLFAYGTWSDYRSKDSGPQLLTLRNLEFITWGGI